MIATLSMYDWPETRSSLERFWALIASELERRDLPHTDILQQTEKQMPLWTSPDLLIGQTCGWPYANQLRGKVVPFARFDFSLEGCSPGTYRSIYIGQQPEDKRYLQSADSLLECPSIAMNSDDSQSGFHVFAEVTGKPAPQSILTNQRVITCAHRNSIKAVANGEARIAAIDAVAFAMATRYDRDFVSTVHTIGYSEPKPGLPLITSLKLAHHKDNLFDAVKAAHDRLEGADKDTLMIRDVLPASDKDYDVFLAP